MVFPISDRVETWTKMREEWILSQRLSSVLRQNTGKSGIKPVTGFQVLYEEGKENDKWNVWGMYLSRCMIFFSDNQLQWMISSMGKKFIWNMTFHYLFLIIFLNPSPLIFPYD